MNYLFIQDNEFAKWLAAREKGARKLSICSRMFIIVIFDQNRCKVKVIFIEWSVNLVSFHLGAKGWDNVSVNILYIYMTAIKETLR